ncbi:MAG: ATP-dependent dethiobiotin synthetase BioD, partial [Methylocystis sp.]|nr:ATP-dependent dethiobiotin synthetase BioD [Methylocystis sp.]
MRRRFVIAGTDTGVGKTVFSAALVGALSAFYWKPVQAGLAEETDSQTVLRLSGLDSTHVLPEAWRLAAPVSPHLAAQLEGVVIDPDQLSPPDCDGALVIETAGGLMTPLTSSHLTIDVLARWKIPAILCTRTSLGTINHSLLSIEALRRRGVPIHGVAFVGDEDAGAQAAIAELGRVRALGRLPYLPELTPQSLRQAFLSCFRLADFREECA